MQMSTHTSIEWAGRPSSGWPLRPPATQAREYPTAVAT
jgi:hypothetical protein